MSSFLEQQLSLFGRISSRSSAPEQMLQQKVLPIRRASEPFTTSRWKGLAVSCSPITTQGRSLMGQYTCKSSPASPLAGTSLARPAQQGQAKDPQSLLAHPPTALPEDICSPSPPSHLFSHCCHLSHPNLLQGALRGWAGLLGAEEEKQRCRQTNTTQEVQLPSLTHGIATGSRAMQVACDAQDGLSGCSIRRKEIAPAQHLLISS